MSDISKGLIGLGICGAVAAATIATKKADCLWGLFALLLIFLD